MEIISGWQPSAYKVVIYGPEGIGKSTFASQFPEPVFIDTEGSTKFMDVRRFKPPQSWTELLSQVQYTRDTPGLCRTLVVDTADWAEQLCMAHICAGKQLQGIEDLGYGKGYVYLAEAFGKLLNLLEEVVGKGVHVAVTAHAAMRKFEQPDELGAYDRWELKLQKKTAPLLKEWADLLLFANYKTISVAVDKQGTRHKAQGGKRVMYATHHPCWDAKNRFNLPDELPFSFEAIAPVLFPAEATPKTAQTPPPPPAPAPDTPPGPPAGAGSDVPAVLRPLMEKDGVLEAEVRDVIAQKGYYTADTPWRVMLESGFVDGWVVPFWDKIAEMVQAERKKLPF